MSNVLFVFYIFVLSVILIYIYIWGTKSRNKKLLEEMDKKQQEILVLQIEVKDMLLVLETYMQESKEDLGAERAKIEFLISKFEKMATESALATLTAKANDEPEPKRKNQQIERQIKIPEPQIEPEEDSKSEQYAKVKDLLRQGKNIDEIASELGLSKGEAKFIINISK